MAKKAKAQPAETEWRVYLLGKGAKYIGTVSAGDEKTAMKVAAEEFSIEPARRFRLSVKSVD
jgi:hypothetical protein